MSEFNDSDEYEEYLEPLGHRLLVEPDPIEEVSKGGIIINHGSDKKRVEQAQIRGVLLEVGENAWKAFDDGRPWAAVGDRVYFAKYGGVLLEFNGCEYRLLNDEDLTARVVRRKKIKAEDAQ